MVPFVYTRSVWDLLYCVKFFTPTSNRIFSSVPRMFLEFIDLNGLKSKKAHKIAVPKPWIEIFPCLWITGICEWKFNYRDPALLQI